MKKGRKGLKTVIDLAMMALILILMAYHVTGNRLHEWLGILLFLLFFLHHFLNLKWYGSLVKGKYGAPRIVGVVLNFLLLADMACMMVSSVMISRDVFCFLDIGGGEFGRRMHMVSVSWGFVLMSVHLGFHGGMMSHMAGKRVREKRKDLAAYACRLMAAALSVYGICAFGEREMGAKMFLMVKYSFFDQGEPATWVFADYFSVMVLFAVLSYYGMRRMRKR